MTEAGKKTDNDGGGDEDRDCELNGYILNGILIPETTLEILLSYTHTDDILSINRVCKLWKELTTRDFFWKHAFERKGRRVPHTILVPNFMKKKDPWIFFYCNLKNPNFSNNFIQNPSGHDQFQKWNILESSGNGFRIESPPTGIEALPPLDKSLCLGSQNPERKRKHKRDSCFATSYGWCRIQQKIDLREIGLTSEVLESMLPFEFVLSEMVGSRFDCGAQYKIRMELQSDDQNQDETNQQQDVESEIEIELEDRIPAGAGWRQVRASLTLNESHRERLRDIRYLTLTNHGKDTQFWAGHYGVKFSRMSVTVQSCRS